MYLKSKNSQFNILRQGLHTMLLQKFGKISLME